MALLDITYQRDPTSGAVLFDGDGNPLYGTNSGANTYAQMQARVQNEVLGSPTTNDIKNAIQDAIAEYERESFWFNDMRTFGASGSASDLRTVSGKEFYSNVDLPVLVNMPHLRTVLIVAFSNRYTLNARTPQWIDDNSISTTWQGLPTDYCWQAGSLRLYPVPNDAYQIILDGTIRFPALSADSDYSPWTNQAERLIRTEAKRLLFREITRDDAQAAAMELELMGDPRTGRQGALTMLRRETVRRAGGPGKLRPSRGHM
jgi:hypothetical protein